MKIVRVVLVTVAVFSLATAEDSKKGTADSEDVTVDEDRDDEKSDRLQDIGVQERTPFGLQWPDWMSSLWQTATPSTTLSVFPYVSGMVTRAQDFIDRLGSAKTVDDRLRHVLGALEGLDEMLRSTVPRLDQFNCLERVMCEVAAPFDSSVPDRGNNIDYDDGVQTLQQLHNSPVLPPFRGQQHLQPHQQQFLQHQQHQQQLIQQQLQQQQQQEAPPPLPYYIPTPLGNQREAVVSRESESGEKKNNFPDNSIRRDEPYRVSNLVHRDRSQHQHIRVQRQQQHQTYYPQQIQHQYQYQQPQPQQVAYAQQPQPQQVAYTQQPQQVAYSQQQGAYSPHGYQVASHHSPAHPYAQPSVQREQFAAPPLRQVRPQRRRRPTTSLRGFLGNMFGMSGDRAQRRRHRRDTETPKPEPKTRSSRRSKIAPAFLSDEKADAVKKQPQLIKSSRTSKLSPAFQMSNAIPKSEMLYPPIKTLSKGDLEAIKARIEAVNREVLRNATNPAFGGRASSNRQARFLSSFLSGWSAKNILGLLNELMKDYSFHPYTHAAYMGYSSRAGTCATLYPKCPDDANDMLDFVNNFYRYFPNGVPFADRLPWPLNLLVK